MNLTNITLLLGLSILLIISTTVNGSSLRQARENDHNIWLRINKRFAQPNNDDRSTMLFIRSLLRTHDDDEKTLRFDKDSTGSHPTGHSFDKRDALQTWCNQNPATCQDGWEWCEANRQVCEEKAKDYCKKYSTAHPDDCEQFV
ncbi:unnamed protein product [Didymodactylos carnosus]|uniref:Uncharacterized protein n=1 Tax=Didymodactylos carnosus TaxID=1234261 RepID=A0A814XXB3_9BILA|nr:unnamed protein product [Didymodactylos carnosus]CAF1221518.1 unnamed protein product [Didymodactylos carnosus]CAF3624615.1 unnamed protein product [Didymodactylos carnosus]CAF3984756.1 unnamed protein product [Didymodactylos carnosus]